MFAKKIFKPTFYFLFLTLMASCSEDDDDAGTVTADTYSTEVYLTDAPIDNAEINGVFVTVAEVRVNGETLEGFQKTTVEVSSLTDGATELLGTVDLEAGTTSDIVLVLDSEADASGEAPGNYILTTSGEKQVLTTAENSISISDNAEIFASDNNELILDFDLRKSIAQDAEGTYSLVNTSELANNIRVVNGAETGTITGNISGLEGVDADALVVYAYQAGAYTEAEAEAGENGLDFTNAVSSTTINQTSGDYSLHFLEEGDYELVLASYKDEDGDGNLELQGQIASSTGLGLDLLSVEANSTVELNFALEALFGI